MSEVKLNENSLDGMRCPACGSFGPFLILGTTLFEVHDDGIQHYESPDWDAEGGSCSCKACGHEDYKECFEIVPKVDEGTDARAEDRAFLTKQGLFEVLSNLFAGDNEQDLTDIIRAILDRDVTGYRMRQDTTEGNLAKELLKWKSDYKIRAQLQRANFKVVVRGGVVEEIVSNVPASLAVIDWDEIKQGEVPSVTQASVDSNLDLHKLVKEIATYGQDDVSFEDQAAAFEKVRKSDNVVAITATQEKSATKTSQ